MKNKLFFIISINILVCHISLHACDYCLLTQGISPLETARGIGLRADERYTRLSTLLDHGDKIDNEGAKETHWTTQVTGFYSVTPRLTFTAVVPYVRRFEQEGEAGGHHNDGDGHQDGKTNINSSKNWFIDTSLLNSSKNISSMFNEEVGASGSSSEFSDISVFGRYQVLNRHSLNSTFIAALQGGIRFPTGKTDATNEEGEILNAHIQPGTGAFNYLFGFSVSYAIKKVSFVANSLYSLTTEGNVGNDSYEYGNVINYDASVRYRLSGSIQSSTYLFASLGVAGEHRQEELLKGDEVPGTGGQTIYLLPGFQVFFRPFIFEASFWVPVIYDLHGRQLAETFKGSAGFTFLWR
jgi:hypothetical protein